MSDGIERAEGVVVTGDRDRPIAPDETVGAARIVVRPTDRSGNELAAPVAVRLPLDTSVDLGREADVPVGVSPYDVGISRVALVVTVTLSGWRLLVANRNGAVVHPWAQPPSWVSSGASYVSAWPRLGVRLTGSDPDELLHWVLLEFDGFSEPLQTAPDPDTSATLYTDRPDALTSAQELAVTALFGEHLAWPPKLGPTPESLKRVARRLDVSQAAVIQRLEGAQKRAYQLGSHAQIGVTEPDYFYALVRHGYLSWPVDRVEATEIELGPNSPQT